MKYNQEKIQMLKKHVRYIYKNPNSTIYEVPIEHTTNWLYVSGGLICHKIACVRKLNRIGTITASSMPPFIFNNLSGEIIDSNYAYIINHLQYQFMKQLNNIHKKNK